MRKKNAGTVCVVCLVALVALLALWVAPIMVQVDSVTQTKETFYREATVSAQKAAIQKPGVIDFAPLKSKSVLPFLKTKACVATVKKVETLYKKDSQENTYQACNLVELKVVKNIAGGFQKGESVYVIDSEMALYAEDIGKDGVFIPDKMASEITISGEKETIHTVGCVKKSESRIMLLPEEDNYAKVSDYWKLKHYMKKNNYIK